jgi:hypothetical protein
MSRTPARSLLSASLLAASRRAGPFLLALALLPCFAGGTQALTLVGNRATFSWAPAAGPVAGYRVFVSRNGAGGSSAEMAVTSTSATVAGNYDDQLSVRVAAFDSAGNQGPLSASSEVVILAAPTPTAPAYVVIEATADFSIQAALETAGPDEQVVAHMQGSGLQFLDASPPEGGGDEEFGLDQLIVGLPGQATTVRLVDAVGLDQLTPLSNLPTITLAGLGNGAPCERDGAAGLVIHAGSRLELGGIDLYAFDGETCVHVNELFPGSPDPNVVTFGAGTVALHGDLDEDGVLDPEDNCLLAANESQCDGDGDGFGNACDFDANMDGAIGLDDLSYFMSEMRTSAVNSVHDFNCDGGVGLDDYGLLVDSLEQPPGPSGLACTADASCMPPQ